MTNKRNASGAPDPTAYEAIKNTTAANRIDHAAGRIAEGLKKDMEFFGFKQTSLFLLVHIKSGRRYEIHE